jgi:hypothetical protein
VARDRLAAELEALGSGTIVFGHSDLYANRLPSSEVHPLDGCGHLCDRGGLSPIVSAVRSL